jgi:hypothetical protein
MKTFLKKKNYQRPLALFILAAFIVSCSKKIEVEVPGLTETGGQEVGANGLLVSGVGVLDFFAVNRKFSQQTRIPHTNGTISQSWNTLKGSLAQDSHPSGINGNGVLSLGKHAALYCDLAFANPPQAPNQDTGGGLREVIMPGFDFTRNPAQAFTSATKPQIVSQFMNHFWGTGISRPEGAEATLVELLDSLSSNLEPNQNTSFMTANILAGLCTATMISFNNIEL